MTLEEFDSKLQAAGDWFIAESKRTSAEFAARLESLCKDAEHLPAHLTKAALQHQMARLEKLQQEIEGQ